MAEPRKKPSKLESVVLGAVLAGLSIGFAYGALKGCEYLAERLAKFNNSYITIPSDDYIGK